MGPKKNPLNLNPLQLKTLTLLQELAQLDARPAPDGPDGALMIAGMPQPHGDHFHLGDAMVMSRDATGLRNPGVWAALERKGLVRAAPPDGVVLMPEGVAYDTGLRDRILLRTRDH